MTDRNKWVPWEPLVGLRVGALGGAVIGAVLAVIFGTGWAWLIFVIGLVGGIGGYWYGQEPE
jgi:hypothetical protein